MTCGDYSKIVITRPQAQGEQFALKLYDYYVNKNNNKSKCISFEKFCKQHIIYSPVMKIETLNATIPSSEEIDGLLITSANAITEQIRHAEYKNMPVYVVGTTTAQVLKEYDFRNIIVCAQTISDLRQEMINRSVDKSCRLLYLRGVDITDGVELESAFPAIRQVITYRASALDQLSVDFKAGIEQNELAAVLFFSKRSAMIFCDKAKAYWRHYKNLNIKALCLSEAMVDCVRPLFEQHVYVSKTPDLTGMLNLVHEMFIKGIVK